MEEKIYNWDADWWLIFKKQHVYNLPPPEKRWFGLKPDTCPLCHKKLIKTMCIDDCIIHYWVVDCECGYQYASSDGEDTESFTETYQYQWLDVTTGKNYPDNVCQKILDEVNRKGNVEVQKMLSKIDA